MAHWIDQITFNRTGSWDKCPQDYDQAIKVFHWQENDANNEYWYPQGICTFQNPLGEDGIIAGWYHRAPLFKQCRGARISIIRWTEQSDRPVYRHILLKPFPFMTFDGMGDSDKALHMSGMALRENLLYVTDARKGIWGMWVFDLQEIAKADRKIGEKQQYAPFYGYGNVLIAKSFISLPFRATSLSYQDSSNSFLSATFNQNHASKLRLFQLTNESSVKVTHTWQSPKQSQGALIHQDQILFSQSYGRWNKSTLSVYPFSLENGPNYANGRTEKVMAGAQDLEYDVNNSSYWTQYEFPGVTRRVIAQYTLPS